MNFQTSLFADEEPTDEASEPAFIAAAGQIANMLADGRHLTRRNINEIFADVTCGSDAAFDWSVDESNHAVELGALLWLRDHSRIDGNSSLAQAVARLDWLKSALPPRHVRSEQQNSFQQFSTPPILGWLMSKAAQLCCSDLVLEPSAGTGMLALWPALQSVPLILNEISAPRRLALGELFPGCIVSAHDGELIDELLPADRQPTAILINPPFARSAERGADSKTALRHLRAAFRLASLQARIVAIMPESFKARDFVGAHGPASLMLDVVIDSAFREVGTGVSVRLVVIDKGREHAAVTHEEVTSLSELHQRILALPDRLLLFSPELPALRPYRALAPTSAPARNRPTAPFANQSGPVTISEILEYTVLDAPADLSEQIGIYLPYRPSRVAIPGAPPHPTALVESVAMGSVPAPKVEAKPLLPAGWKTKSLLSRAQCETLIYAASAFERDLPGKFHPNDKGTQLEIAEIGHSYRQGFFLGDGTGAGKGRQIAAIIMDRWLSGERRHIWISKNATLLEDARRDWQALGGLQLDIQPLSSWKLGQPVGCSQAILFVTYPTLRSGRMEDTRLDQIVSWAGEEFEGVIAFDEAHAMANALGSTGSRGLVSGSEQGIAGLRLQNFLPRARILYASATGASNIANLGYATRLGLWGQETAFPTYDAFLADNPGPELEASK